MVVNKINFILGNYGETINHKETLNLFQGNDSEVEELTNDLVKGNVDALIVYDCNPVYSLPNGASVGEAISGNTEMLKVSLSEYADETAVCCQYVCPNHNYLESWNDFEAINGHVSLQQPTIRPLYNTRQAQESFLVWSGQTERGSSESKAYYNFIRSNWKARGFSEQDDHMSFDDFWNWSVHNGYTNEPISSSSHHLN